MKNLKKRIIEDLKNAETNKIERMVNTVGVILTRIKMRNLKTNDEILDMLESVIVAYGERIVKDMEKGDIEDMETSMFKQNIYNEYVSEFRLDY